MSREYLASKNELDAIKTIVNNKVDNEIFVAENLIHCPYNNDTATSGGITFTDNEDGSIAVTGSVTKANTNYSYKLNPNEYTKLEIDQTYILNNCGDLDDDCYLRLFYKADNGTETYLASTKKGSYTFTATEVINEIRIWVTVNCDDTTKEFNNIIKPMLEVGSVAHAYQPYKLSRKAIRDDIDAKLDSTLVTTQTSSVILNGHSNSIEIADDSTYAVEYAAICGGSSNSIKSVNNGFIGGVLLTQ